MAEKLAKRCSAFKKADADCKRVEVIGMPEWRVCHPLCEARVAKSMYRIENLELATLLRALREETGMVQTALAERLGRTQTFVSNVELGIRLLDLVELRHYCAGLGITLVDMVTRWETQIAKLPGAHRSKSKRAGK